MQTPHRNNTAERQTLHAVRQQWQPPRPGPDKIMSRELSMMELKREIQENVSGQV